MTTRAIPLVLGEFYHVYNRGTDKRVLFLDSADYIRFIELLFLSNSEYSVNVRDIKKKEHFVFDFDRGKNLVAIGAYCLMPNHFHLLITPLVEDGVSIFMGKLCTSYSMYFNRRYERTGALFQGAFKSEHVAGDEYLKYLYSYIHLNPIKLIDKNWKEEGIQKPNEAFLYSANYEYSSLMDYLGDSRPEKGIINPVPFPTFFSTHNDIKTELLEWINFRSIIIKKP